ncbi:hypothetical protein BBD42_21590 [Paenibacillus sp. BIHB 4019]|uniref:Uncharacterized protein n=1 Tax=Paenibacillus sp. BIHB 4019 TaxID=1870819 RepID=A0A1B2DM22_9BACL|nr:hypothetical protein [Paenibacillus sp. BIHB 4019]ANY68770.1 hypothetical protein BBD42_21590 [Paenibacillus sp. BIHB 4019]
MEEGTNDYKISFKNIAINTTTVIALFTIFFYVVAYRYEAGYKSYFHIPDKLIELNILTLIRPNIPITTILVLVATAFIIYIGIVFLLFVLIDKFIIKKIFSKRLIESKDLPTILKFMSLIIFLGVILSSYNTAYNFGKDSVLNMKEYWVYEAGDITYAIIDTYNGGFISIPININEFTFKAEYKFIDPESLSNGVFKNVKLQEALREKIQ